MVFYAKYLPYFRSSVAYHVFYVHRGASDSQDDSIVFDHEDTTDDVTSSELEVYMPLQILFVTV